MLQGRPVIFVLQGFGNPQGGCAVDLERRGRLVELVRARLDSAGVRFVDLSQKINQKLKDRPIFGRCPDSARMSAVAI